MGSVQLEVQLEVTLEALQAAGGEASQAVEGKARAESPVLEAEPESGSWTRGRAAAPP